MIKRMKRWKDEIGYIIPEDDDFLWLDEELEDKSQVLPIESSSLSKNQ